MIDDHQRAAVATLVSSGGAITSFMATTLPVIQWLAALGAVFSAYAAAYYYIVKARRK